LTKQAAAAFFDPYFSDNCRIIIRTVGADVLPKSTTARRSVQYLTVARLRVNGVIMLLFVPLSSKKIAAGVVDRLQAISS